MKTMTCNQLGGPSNCNHSFHADNWEDMKALSQQHGSEMFAKNDADHLKAMEDMKLMIKNPQIMKQWMAERKQEFDALPKD